MVPVIEEGSSVTPVVGLVTGETCPDSGKGET